MNQHQHQSDSHGKNFFEGKRYGLVAADIFLSDMKALSSNPSATLPRKEGDEICAQQVPSPNESAGESKRIINNLSASNAALNTSDPSQLAADPSTSELLKDKELLDLVREAIADLRAGKLEPLSFTVAVSSLVCPIPPTAEDIASAVNFLANQPKHHNPDNHPGPHKARREAQEWTRGEEEV